MVSMNTTGHWRSNITKLFFAEFLELARRYLKPGGVLYFNTTGSSDVPYTAARVYRYVARYSNSVAASGRPFTLSRQERLANLLRFGSSESLSSPETAPTLGMSPRAWRRPTCLTRGRRCGHGETDGS